MSGSDRARPRQTSRPPEIRQGHRGALIQQRMDTVTRGTGPGSGLGTSPPPNHFGSRSGYHGGAGPVQSRITAKHDCARGSLAADVAGMQRTSKACVTNTIRSSATRIVPCRRNPPALEQVRRRQQELGNDAFPASHSEATGAKALSQGRILMLAAGDLDPVSRSVLGPLQRETSTRLGVTGMSAGADH